MRIAQISERFNFERWIEIFDNKVYYDYEDHNDHNVWKKSFYM